MEMNKTVPLFDWLDHRAAGVLLHPTCFPGGQGCGVLDASAIRWLDFLAEAGIRYWQVCPLGPTGFGNSPYQCFSAFAGNPYLIDLAPLREHGLLDQADLGTLKRLPQERIDFGALYEHKWPLLFKAHSAFKHNNSQLPWGDFPEFKRKHQTWLEPYCLFMALKDWQNGQPWWEWPESLRFFARIDPSSLPQATLDRADAYAFCQYIFFGQWQTVRDRASERGIDIIGDAPIFVAADSADVWQHPQLFLLDQKTGLPRSVAGVPPDYFSTDGQLWGNPLYDWPAHEQTDFSWWIERLRANFELCDVLRIDHFRAFDSCWEIPAGSQNAHSGQWRRGPGLAFFQAIAAALPQAQLIAEDLGDLLPSVHELRHKTGLPGMAILQFAFGGDAGNGYLPHNHQTNCAVYPGTHDNDTTLGWYRRSDEKTRDHARRYLRVSGDDISWDFVRAAYQSVCRLALIPLQDLLGLDSDARFNTPGVASGNWQWRYRADQLESLRRNSAANLRGLAGLYGRTTATEYNHGLCEAAPRPFR